MTNALERDGSASHPRTEAGIADVWPYAERRRLIRPMGSVSHRRATDRQRAASDECRARAKTQRRGLYATVAIDGCVAALGALAIGIVARPVNVPMWVPLLFIPAVIGTWLTATALTGCHEMAIRDVPAAEIRNVLLAGIVLFNAAVITAHLSRHVLPGLYLVALAPLTTGLSLLARSGLRIWRAGWRRCRRSGRREAGAVPRRAIPGGDARTYARRRRLYDRRPHQRTATARRHQGAGKFRGVARRGRLGAGGRDGCHPLRRDASPGAA